MPDQVKHGDFEGTEVDVHMRCSSACAPAVLQQLAHHGVQPLPSTAGFPVLVSTAQTLLEQHSLLAPCLHLLLHAYGRAPNDQVCEARLGCSTALHTPRAGSLLQGHVQLIHEHRPHLCPRQRSLQGALCRTAL